MVLVEPVWMGHAKSRAAGRGMTTHPEGTA